MKINQDITGELTDCVNNLEKIIFRLFYLQHHQLRLVMPGGSPPRTRANYRQRSELDINSPRSVENHPQDLQDFVDISNTVISTALGGSTTTSPLIVIVILRQQLEYAAPTMPHPIKAKFSSSKSRFLFTFCRTRHSGAPP
jgi:hypothetical protein